MNAYDTYVTYLALKLHFGDGNYDFFKYQGKVKADPEKFQTRKDRFHFEKIKRRFDGKDADIIGFFVSMMHENPKVWIGQIANKDSYDHYIKWKAYQESLTYKFSQAIAELHSDPEYTDFNSMFTVNNGDHPWLLEKYYSGVVSKEVIIGMNSVLRFVPKWNNQIQDDILWPNTCNSWKRYAPFLEYNKDKIKEILQKEFL